MSRSSYCLLTTLSTVYVPARDAPVRARENEYQDPRADELRARFHALFGGEEILCG
jgi:hypothetical protein